MVDYIKVTERIIPHIEEAVGLKLYETQKRYLIEGIDIFRGRRSGETVAHAIKVALTESDPLDFRKPYKTHFEREFLRYQEMLYNYGFPVRPIILPKKKGTTK